MERTLKAVDKRDWLGLAASLLEVAACYGTLAVLAIALIVWVIFAQFDGLIELVGFALLVGGAVWDRKLREPVVQKEARNG